jgi:hypothetical protein
MTNKLPLPGHGAGEGAGELVHLQRAGGGADAA